MRYRATKYGSHAVAPTKLMKIPEAARELAISTRTAWRLIGQGELTSVRLGRAVRITRASLDAFVAKGGQD